MKIVKRISDGLVLFAGNDLSIDSDSVNGAGWTFEKIDVTLLTLEDVDALPEFFVTGGWTYQNGEWTTTATGDDYMLPQKRAKKIAELEAARLAIEYSDIVHDEKTWKADKTARELLAQVLAPGSVRENAYWRDAGNVKRTMTYADLQSLGRAISDRGYDADENLETKKAAVNAALTAEEIDAVTW